MFNTATNTPHGGAEIQMSMIAKRLKQEFPDWEISFVVGDFGQSKTECYDGIRVYKSVNPKSTDNIFRKIINALVYLSLLIRINPDLVFTSTANTMVAISSAYSKLFHKNNIHRTANIHDVSGEFENQNGFVGKLYAWGVKRCTTIITQNYEQQSLLKQKYNKESVVIRSLKQITHRCIDNSKRSYFLWSGRITEVKQPEIFVELAKVNPNKKFVLLALVDENDTTQNKFREIRNSASNLSNLTIQKNIPHGEIQEYYDKAIALINTSKHEGFPNTFIEAGLSMTPIISLHINPDNFILEENAGIFCENDVKSLQNAVNKYSPETGEWPTHSENLFKYIEREFDIEKNIYKIIEVIQNAKRK